MAHRAEEEGADSRVCGCTARSAQQQLSQLALLSATLLPVVFKFVAGLHEAEKNYLHRGVGFECGANRSLFLEGEGR